MVVFGVCSVCLSVAALLAGMAIEYEQRRESGPVALVPTLQYAGAFGLLLVIGLTVLHLAREWPDRWWWIPIFGLAAMAVGGWAIAGAGRMAERRRGDTDPRS